MRTQTALEEGHEPAEADFRDDSSRHMSPDFVFFAPKVTLPSLGANAELLADYEGPIDPELRCPLSQETIMTDPVRIKGQPIQHVFERSWIQGVVESMGKSGKVPVNPMTNLDLPLPVVYEPAADIAEKIAAKMEEVTRERQPGFSL